MNQNKFSETRRKFFLSVDTKSFIDISLHCENCIECLKMLNVMVYLCREEFYQNLLEKHEIKSR